MDSRTGRLRREILNVGELEGAQRDAVRAAVGELSARSFAGERAAGLMDLMFDTDARIIRRIQLFRDAADRVVGFVCALRQDVRLDGRVVTVFRAVAAIAPQYRHGNRTALFGLREAARLRLRHPWRPAYLLTPILHPSSYTALARFSRRLYPSPRRPHDPTLDRLVVALADLVDPFGPSDGPLLRERRISVRNAPVLDTPYARFYLAVNPRFAEGYGLLVLVPLAITDLLSFAARRTMTFLRPWARRDRHRDAPKLTSTGDPH
jgi:hypothetical protein